MKKIFCMLVCGAFLHTSFAQSLPKWAGKARKAVCSVITYTKDNKILNTGNGFYINEKGIAVSDYSLFKGADRAVVVTADGKELPVEYIVGANDMYDVIKFKTATDKKMVALPIAANGAANGETIYLLPYSTQKTVSGNNGKVTQVDSIANNSVYYTLEMAASEKTVSCPVMNEAGEVVGMMQKGSGKDGKESYALGIRYAASLSISALSFNDFTLNSIGIKKGLPEDESQAIVYLYMASSQLDGAKYLSLLDDFIAQFPDNKEGYLRKAAYYINTGKSEDYSQAENYIKKALEVNTKKDEVHYEIAKMIYSYRTAVNENEGNKEWSYARALDEINQALSTAKEPIYLQQKGDICFAMKDYQNAFQSYNEVNHTSLASAATFYSAAKAKELTEGTDLKEVTALMDSAMAFFNKPYGKEAAPYLYERARVKTADKDFRGAVLDYNDFYDSMMGQVSAEFYLIREQAEMQCKMYQQAINDINKAVELEPKNLEYLLEKGGVLLRLNQLDNAIATFKQIITLDSKQAPAYRMMGYAEIQKGNKKEGLKHLQQAKELGDKVAESIIKKYSK